MPHIFEPLIMRAGATGGSPMINTNDGIVTGSAFAIREALGRTPSTAPADLGTATPLPCDQHLSHATLAAKPLELDEHIDTLAHIAAHIPTRKPGPRLQH